MSAINTIGLPLAALPDSAGELLERFDCGLPVDARICDTDAFLERAWTLSRDLLVAFVDVRLDHDTDNASLSCP